jgi:hypothetical protein
MEGDVNTAFFHRMVVASRRINTIVEIKTESGDRIVSDEDIEKEFILFYKNLYSKKDGRKPLSDLPDWSPITADQQASLEQPFTES